MQQQTPPEAFDLNGMAADLISLLRLRTTVIGIKMFATVEEMAAIPKIRRPSAVHTTDQIVSMASRLGWTVGITGEDLVGAQCRAVIGLAPQDEKFLAGENYVGVWHGTAEGRRIFGIAIMSSARANILMPMTVVFSLSRLFRSATIPARSNASGGVSSCMASTPKSAR